MREHNTEAWHMLTLVGRDQPGIVAGLTRALFQAGYAMGEASMTRLGGNFTIMLMVQGGSSTEQLHALLAPVAGKFFLQMHVDAIDATFHDESYPNVRISIRSAERAAILAQVSEALLAVKFNILDLVSDTGGSQAQPFCIMFLEGYTPGGMSVLESALEPLRKQGVEVRLTPLDTLIA